MILDAIIIVFMLVGLFFFFGASVGVLRFPDFYSRMHAAGKGDTLSTILILLSCTLYYWSEGPLHLTEILVGVKIILVIAFIFIGSPTATHAIMDAGYEMNASFWTRKKS